MGVPDEEALHRLTVIRMLSLAPTGIRHCRSCGQETECFIKHMSPKEVVPGGVDLLREIRQVGLKTAIASVSKNAMTVLQRLDLAFSFDGIADGNSVVHGKPAPDIFIFAAGLLKTPTRDCLGVEDATAGVEAIKAAGMTALGIGPQERFPLADKVMDTLEQKTLQDLLA